MASSMAKFGKLGKMVSTKSPSCSRDSNISRKNSKWLQENLEEMDQNVKRMLELLEDDEADSFAKKVEMYDQKRPELIILVEGIYFKFRSLAERYDYMIKKVQSQERVITNVSSDKLSGITNPTSSTLVSGSKRLARALSSKRIHPGLRSGHSGWDLSMDSDDSSINSYSGTESDDNDDNQLLLDKSVEFEVETCDVIIEKLHIHQEKEKEKAEVSNLQDKNVLSKDNMSDHEHEHRGLEKLIPIGEENLDKSPEPLNVKYDMLVAERDEVYARINVLDAELSSKDDEIDEMRKNLHRLDVEHVKLIAETEVARKMVEELELRIQELDREIDKTKGDIGGSDSVPSIA